jgi:hypothetical protein
VKEHDAHVVVGDCTGVQCTEGVALHVVCARCQNKMVVEGNIGHVGLPEQAVVHLVAEFSSMQVTYLEWKGVPQDTNPGVVA